MPTLTAKQWIDHLHLDAHAEGGYYKEIYRSPLSFDAGQLPFSFGGTRNACTHIYFLLEKNNFSAFHRIKSDELWHFYSGDALIIHEIDETGALTEHSLGNNPDRGESVFCTIRAGSWFASVVASPGKYGLVGCTVSPGFDFSDFELARADTLAALYPAHEGLIRSLCR